MIIFNIDMSDTFYGGLIVQQTQEKSGNRCIHSKGSFRSNGLSDRNRTTETNYKNDF